MCATSCSAKYCASLCMSVSSPNPASSTSAPLAASYAATIRNPSVNRMARSIPCLAPHARQPGLLLARQPGRAVVMIEFDESGSRHEGAPGFEIMIGAIAAVAPAFLVAAARVGAEQYAARLQRGMQLPQHAWQDQRWDMKQRRIGEYSVEIEVRQIKPAKILLPHLAS